LNSPPRPAPAETGPTKPAPVKLARPDPAAAKSAPAQTASKPRRARARRGDGALLHDEIVATTARLLAETGDESAVSIRAIADAVGVTPPSIYLHFVDKTELLFAVCEDRFLELDRHIEEAAAHATDPLDELRRRGEAYVRFGLENPEHYRILFMDRAEAHQFSEERMGEAAAFHHMAEAVQRAIDTGFLAVDDAFLATIGLWSAAHGLTSLLIAKPDFPWPPLDQLIGHVLGGATYGVGSQTVTATSAADATVASMSASVWARLGNNTSYGPGASATPRDNKPWNRPE
jgi:AcrR family transcriptional regulator